jgi:plastocyanin
MLRTGVAVVALIVLPAVARAAEHRVGQKDKTFSVSTITVRPGDSIVFENDDQITHNVYSTAKGSEFNLRAQAPGVKTSVTFNGKGVVEVRCAFHPKMKLIVNVKE